MIEVDRWMRTNRKGVSVEVVLASDHDALRTEHTLVQDLLASASRDLVRCTEEAIQLRTQRDELVKALEGLLGNSLDEVSPDPNQWLAAYRHAQLTLTRIKEQP